MNELDTMRSFRAERASDDPAAREAIRRQLEAHIRAASAAPAAARAPRPRRSFGLRRRFVALAAATAVAAAVAGIVVLSSGPTAEPAAAEILHETAAVAAASDAPAPVPGPGQFYFRKFKRLQLQGWVPPGTPENDEPLGSLNSMLERPGAFNAQVPTTQEWWDAEDGAGRIHELAGTPRFLTDAEKSRWEAAGSPLPETINDEHGAMKGFHFPDTSKLPTDPKALRETVESNRTKVSGFNLVDPEAERLSTEKTSEELFNILQEGNPMTPQLRAAIFNALAELPGIQVNTDAADMLGRRGYAIRSLDTRHGTATDYVFDPKTADLLATRNYITDPEAFFKVFAPSARQRALWQGVGAGFTLEETDYLEAGVVDSTRETAAEAEAGAPVATTAASVRR